jgi:hypothetical protein
MKILFLDIDGVLNSHQSAIYYNRIGHDNGGNPDHFCPIALSNLHSILEEFPDLKLVISSTWRLGETLESMQQKLFALGSIPPQRVISMTPVLRDPRVARGVEIEAWLKVYGNSVSRYVIVDDDGDMAKVKDALIQTDEWHGLMRRDAVAIMDRFYHPWAQASGWEISKFKDSEHLDKEARIELNGTHIQYWGRWDEKDSTLLEPEEYEDLASAKQIESPDGYIKSFIKKT